MYFRVISSMCDNIELLSETKERYLSAKSDTKKSSEQL